MLAPNGNIVLSAGDALIVVDVQMDFLPGGALAAPGGDAVVPVLNRYIANFSNRRLPIFATRCWHPADHCSFKTQGGPWPAHCVAGSGGAQFAPDLRIPAEATVISKATEANKDAYSGFSGTSLLAQLREIGAKRLFIGGLATDYCVLNTVKDGLAAGFAVLLLADAVAAVNVKPDDGKEAESEMRRSGAIAIRHEQIES